jgi:hypothetical protein
MPSYALVIQFLTGSTEVFNQLKKAVPIFKKEFPDKTGVFAFDNASTHRKRADDSLSATRMVVHPRLDWTPVKGGPRMRDGWYDVIDDEGVVHRRVQKMYDPVPSHEGEVVESDYRMFKGMARILQERGRITPDQKMRGQCAGFKCRKDDSAKDCCMRKMLYNEPDFKDAKPHIQEYLESEGQICIFYPRFHCELNFIEQIWGAAKYRYRLLPVPRSESEMERQVISCLDDVPLESIRK